MAHFASANWPHGFGLVGGLKGRDVATPIYSPLTGLHADITDPGAYALLTANPVGSFTSSLITVGKRVIAAGLADGTLINDVTGKPNSVHADDAGATPGTNIAITIDDPTPDISTFSNGVDSLSVRTDWDDIKGGLFRITVRLAVKDSSDADAETLTPYVAYVNDAGDSVTEALPGSALDATAVEGTQEVYTHIINVDGSAATRVFFRSEQTLNDNNVKSAGSMDFDIVVEKLAGPQGGAL